MSVRGAPLQRRIVSPAKVLLADCDSLDGISVVGAAGGLVLSTDHRGGGAYSLEWDKLGTATLGGVALDLPEIINLGDYDTHSQIMIFAKIPTPVGGVIDQIYLALGTDAANLFYWEIDPADIVYDAWAHYHLLMSNVDGDAGVGADLSKVKHIGFYVLTSVAGATLTDILIDEIVVKRGFEVILATEHPPDSKYFQDDAGAFPDWDALAIGGGDITLGVSVVHYGNKTIYFISDALGVLTIEILEPDGATWRTYDTPAIVANTLLVFTMTGQATRVRISFNNAATISAWITLGVE